MKLDFDVWGFSIAEIENPLELQKILNQYNDKIIFWSLAKMPFDKNGLVLSKKIIDFILDNEVFFSCQEEMNSEFIKNSISILKEVKDFSDDMFYSSGGFEFTDKIQREENETRLEFVESDFTSEYVEEVKKGTMYHEWNV